MGRQAGCGVNFVYAVEVWEFSSTGQCLSKFINEYGKHSGEAIRD